MPQHYRGHMEAFFLLEAAIMFLWKLVKRFNQSQITSLAGTNGQYTTKPLTRHKHTCC